MGLHARHSRFVLALFVGAGLFGVALTVGLAQPDAALLGFDGLALCYLALMVALANQSTHADLRRNAIEGDEGIMLIFTLALVAVAASFAAIALVLRQAASGVGPLTAALALAAVPLGWAMVQTLAAFRYAHLHYAPSADCHLGFPETPEPAPWDFLYFSFTIGMAVQTSDVTVTTTAMRKVVLAHSALAYFYNTVILALAVNAGFALAN